MRGKLGPSIQQKLFIAIGCVALAGIASRCSPINSSTSKIKLAPGAPLIGSPTDIDTRINAPPKPVIRPISYSSQVMEFEYYREKTARLSDKQKIVLSYDTHAEAEILRDFLKNRSLQLKVSEDIPSDCKAYFGLSLSDARIDLYDLNTVQTECAPTATDGIWKFSIASNVSKNDWDHISDSLQGMTIYVSSPTKIMIAPNTESTPATPGNDTLTAPKERAVQ